MVPELKLTKRDEQFLRALNIPAGAYSPDTTSPLARRSLAELGSIATRQADEIVYHKQTIKALEWQRSALVGAVIGFWIGQSLMTFAPLRALIVDPAGMRAFAFIAAASIICAAGSMFAAWRKEEV